MRLLLPLALLMVVLPASAHGAGPVVTAGVIKTDRTERGDALYEGLRGGAFKIGFEIGTHHVRNEWAFNQAILSSDVDGQRRDLLMSGFSYQLTVMLFEEGLTPYLTAGFESGIASMNGHGVRVEALDGVYLRPYAALGARLQFKTGLGLKAEISRSLYGEFVSTALGGGVTYVW